MSRHRYDPVYSARQAGDFILAGGAAAGVCVALFDYFRPHNGIDGSWGALLVVASTALTLATSLVLALSGRRPSWHRVLLSGAILLGMIGTVAAAYFLESLALIAMMIIALVGWAIRVTFAPNASEVLIEDREGFAR